MTRIATYTSHKIDTGWFSPFATPGDDTDARVAPEDIGAFQLRDVDDTYGQGVTNHWFIEQQGKLIRIPRGARFVRSADEDDNPTGPYTYIGGPLATESGFVRVLKDNSANSNDTGGENYKDRLGLPCYADDDRQYVVTLDAETDPVEVQLALARCYPDPPASGEPERLPDGSKIGTPGNWVLVP